MGSSHNVSGHLRNDMCRTWALRGPGMGLERSDRARCRPHARNPVYANVSEIGNETCSCDVGDEALVTRVQRQRQSRRLVQAQAPSGRLVREGMVEAMANMVEAEWVVEELVS